MKGKTPTKEEQKHMDRVRALGCIVCLNNGYPNTPAEIHHIIDGERSHMKVLPLCAIHHRNGSHNPPISRHPNKKRFEEAYGTEEELLEQIGRLLEENITGTSL